MVFTFVVVELVEVGGVVDVVVVDGEFVFDVEVVESEVGDGAVVDGKVVVCKVWVVVGEVASRKVPVLSCVVVKTAIVVSTFRIQFIYYFWKTYCTLQLFLSLTHLR